MDTDADTANVYHYNEVECNAVYELPQTGSSTVCHPNGPTRQ